MVFDRRDAGPHEFRFDAGGQSAIQSRPRGGARIAALPRTLLDFFLDRLSPAPFEREPSADLLAYLNAGGAWTGSDAQLNAKSAGLAKLIVGSSEYQFI